MQQHILSMKNIYNMSSLLESHVLQNSQKFIKNPSNFFLAENFESGGKILQKINEIIKSSKIINIGSEYFDTINSELGKTIQIMSGKKNYKGVYFKSVDVPPKLVDEYMLIDKVIRDLMFQNEPVYINIINNNNWSPGTYSVNDKHDDDQNTNLFDTIHNQFITIADKTAGKIAELNDILLGKGKIVDTIRNMDDDLNKAKEEISDPQKLKDIPDSIPITIYDEHMQFIKRLNGDKYSKMLRFSHIYSDLSITERKEAIKKFFLTD